MNISADDAIKLLSSGQAGVAEWNRRRQSGEMPPVLSKVQFPEGADLVGANLSKMNLIMAGFPKANLSNANLRHSSLVAANLYSAVLRDAKLNGIDLRGSDLRKADLSRATLTNGDISQSKLEGTFFGKTRFGITGLGDLDLSQALGLDEAIHRIDCSSSIGLDTIYRSEGKVPVSFLKGCGVPESFLDTMPNLLASAKDYYSCFISYSHADKAFAQRLHEELNARGIHCWRDEKNIPIGASIPQEIYFGLKSWDKVLLCASKSSLTSQWVHREITIALEKEERLYKERGKPVLVLIPLNLDGYLFDWDNGHGPLLRERMAGDFVGWEQGDANLLKSIEPLVQALRAGNNKPLPPESKL